MAAAVILVRLDALPLIPIVGLGILKAIGVACWLAAKFRHNSLNPNIEGKLSTIFVWFGVAGFMLGLTLSGHSPDLATVTFEIVGWSNLIVGIGLATIAVWKYIPIGFGNRF